MSCLPVGAGSRAFEAPTPICSMMPTLPFPVPRTASRLPERPEDDRSRPAILERWWRPRSSPCSCCEDASGKAKYVRTCTSAMNLYFSILSSPFVFARGFFVAYPYSLENLERIRSPSTTCIVSEVIAAHPKSRFCCPSLINPVQHADITHSCYAATKCAQRASMDELCIIVSTF